MHSCNMSDPEKKFDPGWNDPPLLNYTSNNPPPKSRITNKRVAFPLSAQEKPGNNLPDPENSGTSNKLQSEIQFIEALYLEAKENLNGILINVDNTDIKDKTDLMFLQWRDKKFPKSLQLSLCELTKCLKEKNKPEADKLQLDIMIKNGVLCNIWMPAIRYLINLIK